MCACVIEATKGTLEEWPGGEQMTGVNQNVLDRFLLRGNMDFGSLFEACLDRRGLLIYFLLLLSTSRDWFDYIRGGFT